MPFLCPVVLLSNTNAADTNRHLSGSFTVRKVKSGMTPRRQRSSRIPNLLLVKALREVPVSAQGQEAEEYFVKKKESG